MARKHQGERIEASRLRMENRCNYLNEEADRRNAHLKTKAPDKEFILHWEVTSKPKLNPIFFPTPILVLKKTRRPAEKAAA
jgi:hypothetical protein